MDYPALKAAILARPECLPYVITNDMPKDPDYFAKDSAIMDILNADPAFNKQLINRPIKRGDFMRKHGAVNGAMLYARIKSVAVTCIPLQFIVAELEGDGLQVSTIEELEQFLTMLSGLQGWNDGDMALIESIFLEKQLIAWRDIGIALRNY